ncbi:MAG: hypothetical protein HYU36_15480 [Planctomycetes bacterium]|nr:hypothetical protein [Planctomycetota bacterium]
MGRINSGKTAALQALALWELGLRKWIEKRRAARGPATPRVGVVINRRDLVQLPVPQAALLWRHQHLRQTPPESDSCQRARLLRPEEVEAEAREWLEAIS